MLRGGGVALAVEIRSELDCVEIVVGKKLLVLRGEELAGKGFAAADGLIDFGAIVVYTVAP